jgi:DNA replication and repair protein RecF
LPGNALTAGGIEGISVFSGRDTALMFVKSISLRSFRNFSATGADFGAGVNIIMGRNGAGKSNLLEAIFVLLLGRSQRGARDIALIKEGSDYYRVEGDIDCDGYQAEVAVAYQKEGRKKIAVDKTSVRSSQLFEKFSVVTAAPGDVEILNGPPSRRRDFLNIYLSQASLKYLKVLSNYHKALEHKNALLRQNRLGNGNTYDDLIAKYGAEIMLERKNFLSDIAGAAVSSYGDFSDGQSLSLAYSPSVPISDDTKTTLDIEAAIKEKIRRNAEREQKAQMALVGPHRDEIEFRINGFPARTHASQGELRTAAIALKLAIYEYLKKARRRSPILLFDEIFAELDEKRRNRLLSVFGDFGQLFLTSATQIAELPTSECRYFRIENNCIFQGIGAA